MKCDFILTSEQQALVEQNMVLVSRVISRHIRTNEGVCGLGRDDLSQEGALALCRAAASYNGTSAQFSTYAAAVIRNHLLDCCKATNTQLFRRDRPNQREAQVLALSKRALLSTAALIQCAEAGVSGLSTDQKVMAA